MNFKLPPGDDRPIWDLWLSIYHMPAITVAEELGVFRALAQNPGTPGLLSQRLSLNERGLQILLPLLAALGLLELSNENYQLSEIACDYLLSDSPFYWGGVLEVVRNTSPCHQALREALGRQRNPETAESADSAMATTRAWESGAIDPDRAQRMARFMQSQSQTAALGLAGMDEFSSVSRLLDAGGGSGCYSMVFGKFICNSS